MYTLVVLLKDANGKVIECESCQVGIRNVVLAHKQMLVNGCPVVMRGVNRHEHHPRVGKTNIEACMIKVTHFLFIYIFVFDVVFSIPPLKFDISSHWLQVFTIYF